MIAFALALLLALAATPVAATPAPGGPPPGLTPAGVTIAQVLERNAAATGAPTPAGGTLVEVWSEQWHDLKGTATEIIAGDDYRRDTDMGKTHFSSGRYHGQRWTQDYSGYTVGYGAMPSRDAVDQQLLLPSTQDIAVVKLLGVASDPSAYVVDFRQPDGHTAYVYYDETSYLVIRRELILPGRRLVTRFGDFRSAVGATMAWSRVSTDGNPLDDVTESLQTANSDAAVDPGRLQPPESRVPLSLPAAWIPLPARFAHYRVIVTVGVAGRKLDLELDSGSAGIFLDRHVADELGLESFSALRADVDAREAESSAILPEMKIGEARLRDIEAITEPFHYDLDYSTKVVGALGFDFIAGCVLRLDYEQQKLDAIDPSAFVPPADSTKLSLALEHGVPVVSAKIGHSFADSFVLDTGAAGTFLFSRFLAADPEDTLGRGGATPDKYPVRYANGRFPVALIALASLDVGPYLFTEWPAYATLRPRPRYEGNYDGLLGQDILRHFVVYFDYPHGAVYLVPNGPKALYPAPPRV